jgi:ABC-type antimicrobial peptide transport system permease subunit
MFQLTYMLAELRRRRARTILTALGLAVGIALVITTNAVSSGLDDAQQKVLAPLTGVGTDMTVARPLTIGDDGNGGFQDLSPSERARLRQQAGPGPGLNLRDAEPGSKIDTDTFSGTSQLSFSSARVKQVAKLDGVKAASGSLTLRANHISGTVPDIDITQGGRGGAPPQGAFGDSSIEFDSRTVTGVDQTQSDIAPVTPSQIVKGDYFSTSGAPRQAIVSSAYAGTKDLAVGDTIDLGGKTFRIIGIASSPIGGTASDVYVKLSTLQRVADYGGQVSAVQVRATSSGAVDFVAAAIEDAFPNSQVTTASDLAARVGGSLKDARDLSTTLGRILAIVGLVAAVLIASLLTLSSVAKRTRELGTLKAIGWSRWAVVRQISGESLIQGLLGGVVGIAVGLIAILGINASGWTLEASVASQGGQGAAPGAGGSGGGPGGGGFGLGDAAVTAGSEIVKITTSPSFLIVVAAVVLAVLGGLVAGAAGSLRAARLRPATALRTVE